MMKCQGEDEIRDRLVTRQETVISKQNSSYSVLKTVH